MRFTRFPAVKLCIGLALGITIVLIFDVSEAVWILVSGAALVAAFVANVMLRRAYSFSPAIALVYWCAAIACGGLIAARAVDARLPAPPAVVQGLIAPMPAVVQGEIVEIVARDSAHVRCIIEGVIDAQALPRLAEKRVALTIRVPFELQASKLQKNKPHSLRTRWSLPFGASLDAMTVGAGIYALCSVRLPREPVLPTDFNERQYYASLDVQFVGIAELRRVSIWGNGEMLHSTLHSTLRSKIRVIAASASEALQERVLGLFPDETEGFALALLTGNRRKLPAATQREYALAGTAHVLAVSGLHVSLIALVLLVPLGFVRLPWLKFVAFVGAIACFVLATGASPSAVRAGVMSALIVLVRLLQRDAHPLNVVAFTVAVVLAVQPTMLFSVSFQLSSAAVIGLAVLYPVLYDALSRLLRIDKREQMRFVAVSLAVTLASSAVLSPLVAWYFGIFSLVSPLANLVVVPLSSAAMAYTLVAVGCSFLPVFGSWLALPFAAAAHVLLWLMNVVNHRAATVSIAAAEGSLTLPYALVVSVGAVYVATAGTVRLMAFRVAAAVAAGALMLAIVQPVFEHPAIEILPRSQVVAVVIPAAAHFSYHSSRPSTTTIILQDRRPDMFPQRDDGLERFVREKFLANVAANMIESTAESGDSLLICATGTASLYLASRIVASVEYPSRVQVFATALEYKQRRMFEALDSLDARRVKVVNTQEMLRRRLDAGDSRGDSTVRIPSALGIIRWNPWSDFVVLPSGESVLLPHVMERRCFAHR